MDSATVCLHHSKLPAHSVRLISSGFLAQLSQSRGVSILVLHYLLLLWWHRLRLYNDALSVMYPPSDDLLTLSWPQRIVCWCLGLLANMCVAALFFGTNPTSYTQV